MKISFSATNPCHLYPLAVELARQDALGCYYSGYPRWKLVPPDDMRIRTHSMRTTLVYALLKLPERLRPRARTLFLWQDRGFDRWVGKSLDPCDSLHGMPGQCLDTFRAAKARRIRTVLNHATGPVRAWVRIMKSEYERVGLQLDEVCPYDADYFRREDEEYALTDRHCVASSIVRDQLIAEGIAKDRIWIVPYGADEKVFRRADNAGSSEVRFIFAGQVGLRKGIKTLLDALEIAGCAEWHVDSYGTVLSEARLDIDRYRGAPIVRFHGAVDQHALASAFQRGTALVLPSLEEGFGLVVPQALNCGLPVIVSDRVGAKDLVRHRENGSIFPVQNAEALAEEMRWWAEHPRKIVESHGWAAPAGILLALSANASS